MSRERHPSAEVDLDRQAHYDKQGRRLTEAEATTAAAAIERGELDLDEARIVYPRRERGRPSLSAPGEASPKVEARVPAALRTQLTHHAAQHGRPTAEVIREALEEYLARH